MKLKRYQTETLTVLRRFFEEARLAGAKGAYEAIFREPEQATRLGHHAGAYRPFAELPTVPYVCLRLPTGGGKTILGAHAVPIARDAWVEKDWPMVLWLVPSNTIRLQTVEALKNAGHPYRIVLDEAFQGRVRVFDILDFTHIRHTTSATIVASSSARSRLYGSRTPKVVRSTPITRRWSRISARSPRRHQAWSGSRAWESNFPSLI